MINADREACNMRWMNRRSTLGLMAGVAGGALMSRGAFAEVQVADVPAPDYQIEEGAELRVLRPSKFVAGDEELFLANAKKFTEQTGVPVRVDQESWQDLRPKTAVAANVGTGPDIVLAWNDDPHQYPEKIIDLTDLADYLGKKYGGWTPLAETMGKGPEGNWICIPVGGSGGKMVYRQSWLKEAGYDEFPTDTAGFLELAKKMQEVGHPVGFTLGQAEGDANTFCHWLIWSHGASLVDEEGNVTINSPETRQALEYGKELYKTFIPGTLSWLDPSNNKAFLAGEVSVVANGISVYYAAKTSDDPNVQAIAEDIQHAPMPIGPVGKPTETALVVNAMIFQHTLYPNAAKEFVRFMMEKDQYEPWQAASIGYWAHSLNAYDGNPIWTEDPKHTPYQKVMTESLPYGWKGPLGYASAGALADYIVVTMVSSAVSDSASIDDAIAEAEKRAKRYYR
jgi:multiple sugar transport system substrate-binding protein